MRRVSAFEYPTAGGLDQVDAATEATRLPMGLALRDAMAHERCKTYGCVSIDAIARNEERDQAMAALAAQVGLSARSGRNLAAEIMRQLRGAGPAGVQHGCA